jgi:hypothetical protein
MSSIKIGATLSVKMTQPFIPESMPEVKMDKMRLREVVRLLARYVHPAHMPSSVATRVMPNMSTIVKDVGFMKDDRMHSGVYVFASAPERAYAYIRLGGEYNIRLLIDLVEPENATILVQDPNRRFEDDWVSQDWDMDVPMALDRFKIVDEIALAFGE